MCPNLPVIHLSWNPTPHVPSKWVIRIALLQLTFWLLMTIADELRVSNSDFDWGQKQDKSFLQWTDAVLGVLSSCSLLLVGHLVKSHSNISWQGLMLTSFLSSCLFFYVLIDALYGASISEKMVHHYTEVILQLQEAQPILNYFPPAKTLTFVILKITGKPIFC